MKDDKISLKEDDIWFIAFLYSCVGFVFGLFVGIIVMKLF